jgi:hypothetical protein
LDVSKLLWNLKDVLIINNEPDNENQTNSDFDFFSAFADECAFRR